ncbi:MAG: hypothetical protein methR_P1874 [Methyloprofundus sp.]|nr:MAG: hypothetical protein methR_P1874 [Methyloprofundus sp.]
MPNINTPRCPFETVPEEESNQINETAELTVKLLDKRYTEKNAKILRGVHPKSHGCVKATFEINSDIASDLQVGLFAYPGSKYDAIVRFSNAATLVSPDIDDKGRHGSRGMAIKVLNIDGEMLLNDNGEHNQDFLMINQPAFAFANTPDYLRLNRILYKNNDQPDEFFTPLGLQDPRTPEEQKQKILEYIAQENLSEEDIKRIFETFNIVKGIQASGVANPIEVQYFGAAPFLFGSDRVMKFSVKPRNLHGISDIPTTPSDNYLEEALTNTLKSEQTIIFDFMVQIRTPNEGNLEIENSSALWSEANFPFINIAMLSITAPQTEIDTLQNKQHCEKLEFTPWHSLKAHQPIGSINRLRQSVYQASAEHRNKEQGTKSFKQVLLGFKRCILGHK